MKTTDTSLITRRSVARGAAWAAPAIALASAAPVYASSSICEVSWIENVTLEHDGKDPVHRDKQAQDCGDVAIDAWTEGKMIDGERYLRPIFRVIIGSVIVVRDVVARVEASAGTVVTFQSPGPVTSPAGAATPCAYRVYSFVPDGEPVVTPDGASIDWQIGDMPAQSSVMFQVAGDWRPASDETPYVLSLSVTGVKDCDEVWDGPCPDERTGCAPATPWG